MGTAEHRLTPSHKIHRETSDETSQVSSQKSHDERSLVVLIFYLQSVPFVFLCSHTLVNTFLVCCDTSQTSQAMNHLNTHTTLCSSHLACRLDLDLVAVFEKSTLFS